MIIVSGYTSVSFNHPSWLFKSNENKDKSVHCCHCSTDATEALAAINSHGVCVCDTDRTVTYRRDTLCSSNFIGALRVLLCLSYIESLRNITLLLLKRYHPSTAVLYFPNLVLHRHRKYRNSWGEEGRGIIQFLKIKYLNIDYILVSFEKSTLHKL